MYSRYLRLGSYNSCCWGKSRRESKKSETYEINNSVPCLRNGLQQRSENSKKAKNMKDQKLKLSLLQNAGYLHQTPILVSAKCLYSKWWLGIGQGIEKEKHWENEEESGKEREGEKKRRKREK